MTTQDFPKISVLVASATDSLNDADTLLDNHAEGESVDIGAVASNLILARNDLNEAIAILNGVTESEGGEA